MPAEFKHINRRPHASRSFDSHRYKSEHKTYYRNTFQHINKTHASRITSRIQVCLGPSELIYRDVFRTEGITATAF